MSRTVQFESERFFSQNGEDALLWALLRDWEPTTFVEIGAFDGVYLSNTAFLEERGWQGLCIEANPDLHALCQQNRPRSRCLRYACNDAETPGTARFLREPMGLLSGLEVDAADVALRYRNRGLSFEGFVETEVPALCLDGILERHANGLPPPAVISIDVEGVELRVLQGFRTLEQLKPAVLVVEGNCAQQQALITAHLAARGYKLARRVEQNLFFCAEAALAADLATLHVEAWIGAREHPWGPAYTLAEHRRDRRVILTPEAGG